MKKLMENWRNYEKEALNESMRPGATRSPRVEKHTDLTQNFQRDAEWNQVLDPETRRGYQSLLDRTEGRENPDEALFQASEGRFSSRKDLQSQLDTRYSDLVFDPNNPLDYMSAAAMFAGGSGFFTKAALAAEKLGKINDVRKLAKIATGIDKGLIKTGKYIEGYQLAGITSPEFDPDSQVSAQRDFEHQTKLGQYQSEQSTGDPQLDAYNDEDEYEVEAPVETSADPALNEGPRSFFTDFVRKGKDAARAAKRSFDTPTTPTTTPPPVDTPIRAARKAADATFREGTPANHRRIKLSDGTSLDLPKSGSGKPDVEISSAENAIGERKALKRQLTGTKMKNLKVEMQADGKSEEAIEIALNEMYDNGMAEINDWTAGLYRQGVKKGVPTANIDFGVTAAEATKGYGLGDARVAGISAEAQQAAAKARRPDMLTDSPAAAKSWRSSVPDQRPAMQRAKSWVGDNKASTAIGAGTAVLGVGAGGVAYQSAADTRAALEGDPTVTDLTADPEATAETEAGPTAGDPKPIIPAAQPTVVSEPSSPVSPENLKSGDEVEIDGVKYRADESANRSKRVGNIIREEVIRYLNRRAK